MINEGKKRPPRTPLTPEEVSDLIYLKKMREQKKLAKFKKSSTYKALNVINIVCFFIYCEIVCCFFGPVNYRTHYCKQVWVEYGEVKNPGEQRVISAVALTGVDNRRYHFLVGDFIDAPKRFEAFEVGSDFLLGKEIKGKFEEDGKVYKLERASPLLFLSFFVGIFSLIVFRFDLNQNIHSLTAISVINGLTVITFLFI